MALCHSKSWVKSDQGVTEDNRNLSVVNTAAYDEMRMSSLPCCLPLTMLNLTFRRPLGLLLQKNDVWRSFDVASFACNIVSSARRLRLSSHPRQQIEFRS